MTIWREEGGGVRRLMEKTSLNFHFDYLPHPLNPAIKRKVKKE